MLGNPVSIQHQRNARLLSKSTLQGAGTHRTSGRQAQALQAYRVSMREDGAELRLVRRACSRLYLNQIRPHGLAWRLSNTMDADFCVTALQEAIAHFGRPVIFNTDQGSQFTSFAFTNVLKDADIRISMDGRGRWMDNVFIERLWRSLKYECVYLNAFETGSELRAGLTGWIGYYNTTRPHSALGGLTPAEAYAAIGAGGEKTAKLAA